MADAPVVQMGENSPQYVAFRLFREVAIAEGKSIIHNAAGPSKPDRKWILDTYAECLRAVLAPYERLG